MSATCLLQTDLSELRLYTDAGARAGSPEVWTAPLSAMSAPPDAPPGDAPAVLRARAQAAGAWVAQHPSTKRGLSLACIDVREITCLWLRAPSAAPQVLVSSLRTLGQDWGPAYAIGSIESLTPPPAAGGRFSKKNQAAGESGFHGVVIRTPDALARLWLDELDRRGLRPDAVITLWHAMAAAWDDAAPGSDAITAVVLVEPDRRVVWAWSRSGELIAGGSVTLPGTPPAATPTEPAEEAPASIEWTAHAAQRVSLDWLSWSAQTGLLPQRLMIVGPAANEVAAALRSGWKDIPSRCEDSHDPLGTTITRAAVRRSAQPGAAECAGSACLPSLTSRPTRAVRARYMLAGVATLALAAGIAGLGSRFNSAAAATRAESDALKETVAARVQSLGKVMPDGVSNVRLVLDSVLADLRRLPPPRLPPAPRPIWQETKRFFDELAKHEGVKIADQLYIESKNGSAVTLNIPERRTAESLGPALETTINGLSWRRQNLGVPTDQQMRLAGTWIEPRTAEGKPRP